jgi:hypothetical protein
MGAVAPVQVGVMTPRERARLRELLDEARAILAEEPDASPKRLPSSMRRPKIDELARERARRALHRAGRI